MQLESDVECRWSDDEDERPRARRATSSEFEVSTVMQLTLHVGVLYAHHFLSLLRLENCMALIVPTAITHYTSRQASEDR